MIRKAPAAISKSRLIVPSDRSVLGGVSSFHPGGAKPAMMDGSVRFVKDEIDTDDLFAPRSRLYETNQGLKKKAPTAFGARSVRSTAARAPRYETVKTITSLYKQTNPSRRKVKSDRARKNPPRRLKKRRGEFVCQTRSAGEAGLSHSAFLQQHSSFFSDSHEPHSKKRQTIPATIAPQIGAMMNSPS